MRVNILLRIHLWKWWLLSLYRLIIIKCSYSSVKTIQQHFRYSVIQIHILMKSLCFLSPVIEWPRSNKCQLVMHFREQRLERLQWKRLRWKQSTILGRKWSSLWLKRKCRQGMFEYSDLFITSVFAISYYLMIKILTTIKSRLEYAQFWPKALGPENGVHIIHTNKVFWL